MSLFKYKSVIGNNLEHTLDIIENHRLYLANYDDLNDPLEGTYIEPLGFAGCSYYCDTPVIHPHIKEVLQRIGIVSLTGSYKNIAMWAHYASQFQGCCIEFDNQKTLRSSKRVIYKKEKLYSYSSSLKTQDTMKRMKKSVQYKANDWSYEKEYRYIQEIDLNNKETRYLYLEEDEIKKIYLGYMVSSNITKTFERLCKEKKIPLYTAFVVPDKYEIGACLREEYIKMLQERGINEYERYV